MTFRRPLLIDFPYLHSATFDAKREAYEAAHRDEFEEGDERRSPNNGNWSRRVDVAESLTPAEREVVVKEYIASYIARM